MIKSTDIKFYVHTNNNAPILQNTWGQLVGVLDACLINGYNAPVISRAEVKDNVLTLTFSSNHSLLAGQVLLLSGANPTKYNREFRIANIPTLSIVEIDLDDTFIEQPTGVISAKLPPLGWITEFSDVGKRAYRNIEVGKEDRPFFRIIDERDTTWDSSYAKYAKVGIVGKMTDINTMLGMQTPYDMALPDKNWVGANGVNGWARWYYSKTMDVYSNAGTPADAQGASGAVKRWLVVGNGEWFYILPSQIASIYPNIYFFGNMDTSRNLYGLSSTFGYTDAWVSTNTNVRTPLSSSAASFLLHIGSSTGFRALGMQSGLNDGPGGSSVYYEPILSGLVTSDIYISGMYNSSVYRTKMPCFQWLMNPYDASYELTTVEETDSAYLLKTVCATTVSSAVNGLVGFQLY